MGSDGGDGVLDDGSAESRESVRILLDGHRFGMVRIGQTVRLSQQGANLVIIHAQIKGLDGKTTEIGPEGCWVHRILGQKAEDNQSGVGHRWLRLGL